MAPPTLRPLTFGEVLDTSFNLFKRNFKVAFGISATIMIPLTLIASLGAVGLIPADMSVLTETNPDPEELLAFFVPFLGVFGFFALVQILGQMLVQAATLRVYSATYRGETLTFGPALRHGLRRLLAMLGLTIVSSILFLVGAVLCLAPGIWYFVPMTLTPAALIAEHKGVFAAIGRGIDLVRQNWWRTAGLVLVTQMLIGIAANIITTPIQLAAMSPTMFDPEALPSPAGLGAVLFASGVASAFTLPFASAVAVAIYYDLRVRKEGFDLEQMITELGETPETGGDRPSDSDSFGLG